MSDTIPHQKSLVPLSDADALTTVPRSALGDGSRTTVTVPGYEILEELGRGGMGVVYKARQTALNRVVALKMILSAGHAGSVGVERFLSEAEAVAAFTHPNVVQVYEVGRDGELPFMVLEFIDGDTLADRVKDGPLPAKEAARIVEALACGMNAAHQAGIVHRDLKPANVLMTHDGIPKVTDFGLAKRVERNHGMTQTGAILGTPSYMSPEQAGGDSKRVGPATDVYSLGAILYELLTGRPPFRTPNPVDTILQVLHTEPTPPHQLNPAIPRDLVTIALKCLQKQPSKRYESAHALAEDLRRWQAQEPIMARPIGRAERTWRWIRRNPVGSMAVGLLAILLGLAIIVPAQVAQRETENSRRLTIEKQKAESAQADATEKSWQSYVSAARAGRFSRRPGQRFDSLEAIAQAAKIRSSEELRDEAIACLALPDIRISDQAFPSPQTPWSSCEFQSADDGNLTVKRDGEPWAVLPGRFGRYSFHEGSATGRWLAVWYHDPAKKADAIGSLHKVIVWDVKSARPVVITQRTNYQSYRMPIAGFANQGRWFYCTEPNNVTRFWDLETGRILSEARLSSSLTCYAALAADDTRLAAAGFNDQVLNIFSPQTGRVELSRTFDFTPQYFAWHPDGTRLAVACSNQLVQIWNLQTGELSNPFGVNFHYNRLWDSRGEWIISVGWGGYTQLVDVTKHEVSLKYPKIFDSPLVENRYLRVGKGQSLELALPRECRKIRTQGYDYSAPVAFSPDGRWIAICTQNGVQLMPLTAIGSPVELPVGYCESVVFHSSGDLLTWSYDRGLQRWPIRRDRDPSGWIVGPPRGYDFRPRNVQYNWADTNPAGLVALGDHFNNQVILIDPDQPEQRRTIRHVKPRSLALSRDGRWLIVGSRHGNRVSAYDLATNTEHCILDFGNRYEAACVAFCNNDKQVVISTHEAHDFYEVGTWQKIHERPKIDTLGGLSIQPTAVGNLLALCDKPTNLRLLRADDRKELALLQWPEESGATGMKFSPDGRYLVTFADAVRLWDLALIRDRLQAMNLAGELPDFAGIDRSPNNEIVRLRVADSLPPPRADAEPESVQPRRVTLKLDQAPLSDAVAAFKTQTGLPLAMGKLTGTVSLELKNAHPWQALDELRRQAQLDAVLQGETIQLVSGQGVDPEFIVYPGPCRLQVARIQRVESRLIGDQPGLPRPPGASLVSVAFNLVVSPGGRVVAVGTPICSSAKTETNEVLRLVSRTAPTFRPVSATPAIYAIFNNFNAPSKQAKRLSFAGTLPVEVESVLAKPLEFSAAKDQLNRVIRWSDGKSVFVKSVQHQAGSTTVQFSLSHLGDQPFDTKNWLIELIEADGRSRRGSLQLNGNAPRAFQAEDLLWLGTPLQFPWAALALRSCGEPRTVLLTGSFSETSVPSQAIRLRLTKVQRSVIELPFRFQDMPLP